MKKLEKLWSDGIHQTRSGEHLEELVRAIACSNAQLLQQLHHQATESLEGARQSDLRVDLDEDVLSCMHIKGLRHSYSNC